MKSLFYFVVFFFYSISFSQVSIGSNAVDPSAALEVNFSDKGILVPSIALQSNIDFSTVISPSNGLIVYNTSSSGTNSQKVYEGYYFFNGTIWEQLNYKNTVNLNLQSGNYTLTNSDFNSTVIINSSSPVTLTVPAALVRGFKCEVLMIGSGEVTIIGSGVTINSANGTKLRLQNRSIGILKDSNVSAYLFGAISF